MLMPKDCSKKTTKKQINSAILSIWCLQYDGRYDSIYATSDNFPFHQSIMKRPIYLLAMLAWGAALAQADLYDITLSNAQKYTQCSVAYKGASTTKFTGTNKAGKVVTMEVKTSSILMMKEVQPTPAPTAKPAPTPATEDTPAPEPETTEAPATTPEAEAAPAEPAPEPAAPVLTPPDDEQTTKAKDVTLKLREKLALVDSELASLSNPSRSLQTSCKNSKTAVEKRLGDLDKQAIEVADLQTKFNQISGAEFEFTHITNNDRDKYHRDGQAAYKAMLIDVKEYKNARKVGGLDKFEILRERYQGIPEYKEAYKWYMSTLKDLQKRWDNLLRNEQKKRSKLTPAKKTDMDKRDRESYKKLEEYFEKNGEQIAKVWYNPDTRNMVMLQAATAKVKDALRRNETKSKEEAIGSVPDMIKAFWVTMDKARSEMISGAFDSAESTLSNDEIYNKLLRLNRNLLPDDYKNPMRTQRQELEREIKRRARERQSLESKLERAISSLERSTSSAEAQIDSMLERIAREKEVDTHSSTIEIEETKPAPAAQEEPKK